MVAAAPEGQVHAEIMKILITGAGGMLGTDLVKLLAAKYELVGAGRRAAPRLNIPYHVVDLADPKIVGDLFRAERPQMVLHTAAMTDVERCEVERRAALAGNFEVTRNVTEAAGEIDAALIFFSTDFVFDGRKKTPYTEEDPPRPINVYGETKLQAERYLLLKGKRFLILRTSWVFGKWGNPFPRKVLKQAELGKPLPVVTDQIGNPTYTADLARAVGFLLERFEKRQETGWNQVYHAANQGVVSRYDFAAAVLRRKNYPLSLLVPTTSDKVPMNAARPKNSALAMEKIKKQFGVELRPWGEALDAYMQEDSLLTSTESRS